MQPNILRRSVAEFLGTAFLLIAVVGSGIMAERLAGGNIALALLANTLATGAAGHAPTPKPAVPHTRSLAIMRKKPYATRTEATTSRQG